MENILCTQCDWTHLKPLRIHYWKVLENNMNVICKFPCDWSHSSILVWLISFEKNKVCYMTHCFSAAIWNPRKLRFFSLARNYFAIIIFFLLCHFELRIYWRGSSMFLFSAMNLRMKKTGKQCVIYCFLT